MKKYLKWITSLFMLTFVFTHFSAAQTVKRQCIGSYGSHGPAESAVRGQTIGQPFSTHIYSDKELSLTPGFQQPLTYKKSKAVNNMHILALDVFPNPASERFIIESKDFLENAVLRVSSINARLVLEKQLSGLFQYQVDCSDWPAGIYFITIKGPEAQNIYSTKIIITK